MRCAEDRWHAARDVTRGIQHTKGMTHAFRAYDLARGTPYEYNTCDTCSLGTNFREWVLWGTHWYLLQGLGYSGLQDSLAIEFDTRRNDWIGDQVLTTH